MSSKAKVLEKNGKNLRDWIDELGRREFREEVEGALEGFKLPSDRALRDAGKKIVTEIENRRLFNKEKSNTAQTPHS